MTRKHHIGVLTLVGFFILVQTIAVAQSEERALGILQERGGEINAAAQEMGISPRLLASVVYAERSMNIRPGEDVVDAILARTGYNSSVGVAQVKVETARWIRESMIDPKSPWFISPGVAGLFRPGSDEQTLVDQLVSPRANLLYAAAYLRMIEMHWSLLLLQMQEKRACVALVGTLFSLGLKRPDGTTRDPHVGALTNNFGKVAGEFFGSFMLRQEFRE